MTIYSYTALKNVKDIVSGKVEANSPREVRELVRRLGLIPTKIIEEIGTEEKVPTIEKIKLKKLKMREKIDFTNTLQVLIKTGVPIIEALIFVEKNTASKRIQAMAAEVRKQVISGATFAEVVENYDEIFDNVYSGLVRAGEESGELDVTLARMSVLLDKQEKLVSRVKGILMYPAFTIILALLVVLVMLIFVFPAFRDMYENMGEELPFITQACMDVGEFLKTYWFIIPISAVSIYYGIIYLFKWPKSKRKIDEILLKIPIVNLFVKFSTLSNFISVMFVAYEAGIPIVDCLYLANMTVHNVILRDAIRRAATRVQQGTHLSAALKSTDTMPSMLLFMISTGEQSGNLGEMLEQVSLYIDQELERIIDTLTKLIEPLMLIVVGSIVLVLALALYLPMFQSYANMG